MFSRNRSAQLLEQPLLSRFAPDLRRRTRAFAYKPHHKIHNTSPRRAITTEDIHRSREFRQNRGGRFPRRSPILKTKSFIVPPFSSLYQSCIGGASRSFCERFPNLHRHCPQPGAPIALSLGHSTKKQAELHTNKRRRSFPLASSATRPPMWVGRRPMLRPNSPSRQRRGEVRTGNNECALQSSTKRKEKGGEEEGLSGRSSPFVRRNGEKPGIFAE